jgi:hypothetical protein
MKNHMNGSKLADLERRRRVRGILLVLGLAAVLGGCTRSFYREWADNEVNDILKEKDKYPAWKIEQFHVYPDPRARFSDDPKHIDRPPMPPDDEATMKLSPHPQGPGHAGVRSQWGTAYLEMVKVWDTQNRSERQTQEENDFKESGTRDPRKFPMKTFFDEPMEDKQHEGFLLNMDQSIELGVINSPIYQNFREQLYAAALPVTQQRFSFSYQWAAMSDWIRQWAGPASPTGAQNNWTAQSSIGFSKLFSTGALLSADFVNTTAFNFAGGALPAGLSSISNINVSAVQPLLAGGGKAVTLEPLTEAERTLLYSIRAYARFREEFNVAVALGTTLPGDLATASGSTGTTNPISALAALNIASTDVAGGFISYLSTLYRECDMAADKKLAKDLGRALQILEGYQEGGLYSPLQVDTVRSTYWQAVNAVLQDKQFVTNALDQFKLVLGMPANMPLILDDTVARPITRQLDRYYAVIDDSDAAGKLLEQQEKLSPEKLRAFLMETFTAHALVRQTDFQKKIPVAWSRWSKLNDNELKARLLKVSDERRRLLDLKADMELKLSKLTEESRPLLDLNAALEMVKEKLPPELVSSLRETEFEADLGTLELNLRRYESRPWEKLPKQDQGQLEKIKLARLVTFTAKSLIVSARNERFNYLGTLWPDIPSAVFDGVDLIAEDTYRAQELAVQIALTNRFDLMNARAQVVDAWRQLRVTANALMGVLNVGYNLQSQTPPGMHPLAFNANTTSQQLTLDFQLPLNRLAQRNTYRAALIQYQVARRNLMILEDNVAAQVRFDVRQAQLFAANYRIQKIVIKSLYSQVESALEVIVAPADPDQIKASGTGAQAAAAALTSQYLTALGSLNGAQTKMYDIWLSLFATRMQIYLDLERLTMDGRGVWVDEGASLSPGVGVGPAPAPNFPAGNVPLLPMPAPAPVNRPVSFLPLPAER